MTHFLELWMGTAFAADAVAAAPAGETSGSLGSALVNAFTINLLGPRAPAFITILVLAYYMLIRPQQKRELIQRNLASGDKILTGGGIVGTIVGTEGEDFLVVEIAENVKVTIARTTILELVKKAPKSDEVPTTPKAAA